MRRDRRCGEALLALTLVEEDGLAALDGLAERRPLREREAAPAVELLVGEPERRDQLDGRAVVGRERDHAGIGA